MAKAKEEGAVDLPRSVGKYEFLPDSSVAVGELTGELVFLLLLLLGRAPRIRFPRLKRELLGDDGSGPDSPGVTGGEVDNTSMCTPVSEFWRVASELIRSDLTSG